MSRKANIKLGKQANAILERHICSFVVIRVVDIGLRRRVAWFFC